MPRTQSPPQPRTTATARSHHPLYLKKVPTEIWQRLHIEAIQRGLSVTDHVLSVLMTTKQTLDLSESLIGEQKAIASRESAATV